MSTTARKARKRAGIPFTPRPKFATPIYERAIPEHFDKKAMDSRPSKRVLRRRIQWMEIIAGTWRGNSRDRSAAVTA